MTIRLLIVIFLFLAHSADATVLIDSVRILSSDTSAKYEKFEVGIMADLTTTTILNPYNSSVIDIYAIFTSPTGIQYRRDAFWYVEYSRCNTCPNPTRPSDRDSCHSYLDAPELEAPHPDAYLTPQANDFPWRVRFAPDDTGTWTYIVVAHLPGTGQRDTSAPQSFTVTSSNNKGYIYVDTVNSPRYFTYRNTGELFIPIGTNSIREGYHDTLYNRSALETTARLITQMRPYGGNFMRLIMEPFNFGIEWKARNGSGLNNYDDRQRTAFDLDSILRLAEASGDVYLQLTFGGPNELTPKDTLWEDNPYNIANGGFVSVPDSFFTNKDCRRTFKDRVRYIIARWGYSPQVFGYEMKGEVDIYKENFYPEKENVRNWYQEMVQFAKSKDSLHLHTISTVFVAAGKFDTSGDVSRSIYGIPEIDFLQEHVYGVDYNLDFQRNYISRLAAANFPTKPMFYGEIGTRGLNVWIGVDAYSGSNRHNYSEWNSGIWSTLLSGDAGPGMYWSSPASLVHEESPCWGGQYAYFEPLKRFIQGETIFRDRPLPIANPCLGHSKKDEGRTTAWLRLDTINNRCACYPNWLVGEPMPDSALISRGISTTNDSLIEVFGLKTENRVVGWINNKMHYWYYLPRSAGNDPAAVAYVNDNLRSLNVNAVPSLLNDSVSIERLANGPYRLDFFSAWPDHDIDAAVAGAEYGGIIPGMSDTISASCSGIIKFRIPPLVPITDISAPYAPSYGFKLTWLGLDPHRILSTNTTWNTSGAITHSVIVPDGITLTIKSSTVSMPADSFIRVMPGGKLVVDNATLTSTCDTSQWFGIQVLGVNQISRTATREAPVVMKNGGMIRDAKYGITNAIYEP